MMAKIVKWYFLMNKRLFKKFSFVLILLLVPFLVGGITLLSKEESGIVHIALCLENPDEEMAAGIVDELMKKDSAFSYVLCESEEEARRLVTDYEADIAWIFSGNFKADLEKAASDKRCEPVVTVVERKDTVPLMFTRQILLGKIYSDFSYMVYTDFIRDDMGLIEVSEAKLQAGYEKMFVEGSLFKMEYLDGQIEENDDYNYLLMPIRGILALWFVLCGFVASMYFMQDEKNGFFSGIAFTNRLWAAFGVHTVLLSDAAVILLFAFKLSGIFTSWRRELVGLILFAGCTLVFCNLIRLLCRTPERLGVCIPILLISMLVMCPVFVNSRHFGILPYLLPPYYYLKSVHTAYYLYGMMIYMGILFVMCVLVFGYEKSRKE